MLVAGAEPVLSPAEGVARKRSMTPRRTERAWSISSSVFSGPTDEVQALPALPAMPAPSRAATRESDTNGRGVT